MHSYSRLSVDYTAEMARSRPLRYFFVLLILALLGAGFYACQNFSQLLNLQLRQFAQQYGVNDLRLGQMHFSASNAKLDQLWLQGSYGGYVYKASFQSIELHYDWRRLFSGQAQSASVDRLDLSVEKTSSSGDASSATLDIESLLPQHAIDRLPLEMLQIKHMALHYQAPALPLLLASGSLHIAGQMKLRLQSVVAGSTIGVLLSTNDNTPALEAAITLHNGTSDISTVSAQLDRVDKNLWEWQLQGNWDDEPLLAWLRLLAVTTDPPLNVSDIKPLALVGAGEFSASVRHPNTIDLPLRSGWAALTPFTARVTLLKTIERLDYLGTIEHLAGTLDVTIMLEKRRVQLTAIPFDVTGKLATKRLALPTENQQWLRLKEHVPFNLKSSQALNIAWADDNTWDGQLADVEVMLGEPETQLRLEALALNIRVLTGDLSWLKTEFNTRINTRLHNQQLPQLNLVLTQRGNRNESTYTLELGDTAQSILIAGQGSVDITTGRGKHHLSAKTLDLPYFISSLTPLLRHFELMNSDMALRSGSLLLDTNIQTDTFDPVRWTQTSTLNAQQLTGNVDVQQFENLALSAQWSGIEQWQTHKPISLTLEKLDTGLEVRDINVLVSMPAPTPIAQPALRIDGFSATVFKGTLSLSEAASWDFGAPDNTLLLRARQWQLADLVALQQDENIRANGVLEGELPVTVSDGRLIIENGYLRALPPGGSIRYVPSAASQSLGETSKELALALDLLSDFRYQLLSTEVELKKTGTLLLGLSLAGSNPERFEGRKINFNINLEQNIDPLLQSLRVSDTLVEKIEHRLK